MDIDVKGGTATLTDFVINALVGPEARRRAATAFKDTIGVMLAGVFSGGVYKSPDGGSTWQPPAPGNGMPSSETVYGLTSNIPGMVYATAGSGVYVSVNAGSTWTRISDGIPGIAAASTDARTNGGQVRPSPAGD